MSRPDEGLIHAWLDGELDAAEAARVEALVRSDAGWAAAAAEARGFIAASARILGALDSVPANVIPKAPAGDAQATSGAVPIGAARRPGRRAPWWTMRVAALLVIAAGTALVVTRAPDDTGMLTTALKASGDAAPERSAAPSAEAPPASSLAATDQRAAATDAARQAAPAAPTAAKEALPQAAAGSSGAANEAEQPKLAERMAPAGKAVSGTAATSTGATGTAATGTAAAPTTPTVPPQPTAAAARTLVERRADAGGAALSLQGRAALTLEECYREVAESPGAAAVIHRVRRISDTTAVALAQPGARAEEATRFRDEVAAVLVVRGDTLTVAASGGTRRLALRITCPAP